MVEEGIWAWNVEDYRRKETVVVVIYIGYTNGGFCEKWRERKEENETKMTNMTSASLTYGIKT